MAEKIKGTLCKELDRELPNFNKSDLKDISPIRLEKLYKDYKYTLEHYNWLIFESGLVFPEIWDKKFNRKWRLYKDRLNWLRDERIRRTKTFISVKEIKGKVQYIDCFDPPKVKGGGIGGITL